LTALEFESLFDVYAHEYGRFDLVSNPKFKRPDLTAFALLDALTPEAEDIVRGSQDERILLSIDVEHLAARADELLVITLLRCGVLCKHSTLFLFTAEWK
jgi:hypothetical protein